MGRIRTPSQQRGIETKKQIMKTAFTLFSDRGIHGTNSKEIAKNAGISIGSFYSYFPNKKALLLEMLEDYIDTHFKMVWQTLNSLDMKTQDRRGNIKKLIQGAFKAYEISPEFHRQTHALRYSEPDIKRIYDRERKREIDQIQYLIEQNMENFAKIKDPEATAMVIHNAVENVAHTVRLLGTDIKEERLVNGLADMISGFLETND